MKEHFSTAPNVLNFLWEAADGLAALKFLHVFPSLFSISIFGGRK